MVSKKVTIADGSNNRFLSDFIIRSDQFCRVWVYKYDSTLPSDGSGDHLEDDTSVWAFPDNLYVRGENIPTDTEDLVTLSKFDLVDNSILFYATPTSNTIVWLEVSTTPEEFGDSLTQPSVEQAEEAADRAEEAADRAEEAADSLVQGPVGAPNNIEY